MVKLLRMCRRLLVDVMAAFDQRSSHYEYNSDYDCNAVRVRWRNRNRVLSCLPRNKSTYCVNNRDSSVGNNPYLERKILKAASILRVFGESTLS